MALALDALLREPALTEAARRIAAPLAGTDGAEVAAAHVLTLP
ncbi:MAG TPA: hypothetical protein VK459_13400 [Polyangiaceae bacterium]|nr:hypothetical protein [Polyangiaceae bacterium]